MSKPYYAHHVFVCENQRDVEAPRPCCAARGAVAAGKSLKAKVKALGISKPGEVRINKAGCLERCEEGPCLVIYPAGVWYTYMDEADLDEIVQSHLVEGKVVERLRLPDLEPAAK
jgi:(2Fe-2S) ferredoxin